MARITWMGAASALAVCGLVSSAAAQDPAASSGRAAPAKKKPAAKQAPAKTAPAKKKAAEEGASAADPNCPPGAFCEVQEVAPPPPPLPEAEAEASEGASPPVEETTAAAATTAEPEQHGTTVVLPPARDGDDPSKPRTFTYVPDPDGGPGQLIVYEEGAKPRTATAPAGERQWKREKIEPPPEPDQKKWRRHRKVGLNLRFSGALLPRSNDYSDDIGMYGLGMGLRFRPVPAFALELSGDFMGGTDTNGYERQEIPLAATMMVYVNPKSMAQFYLFAGVDYAFARVLANEPKAHLAEGDADEYNYFGGHGGMGLEFRVSRLVGINIDGLAFVRTRVDDDFDGLYPEFYDPETGESSNSSVGGLLRAGVTFWW